MVRTASSRLSGSRASTACPTRARWTWLAEGVARAESSMTWITLRTVMTRCFVRHEGSDTVSTSRQDESANRCVTHARADANAQFAGFSYDGYRAGGVRR